MIASATRTSALGGPVAHPSASVVPTAAARVVVVSVTEGEDKPLKYPYMFSLADVVVINKIDLLPYVDVRLDRLTGHCQEVNAGVRVLPLSVTTGEGIAAWCDWLLTSEPVPA